MKVRIFEMMNEYMKGGYEEACIMIQEGKYQDAKNMLTGILEVDNNNYLAINKLGIVYANLAQLEEAKTCFQTVLTLKSDYAPAIVNLGNIFLEMDDLQNAEMQYKLAMEKDEKYPHSYNNLAIVYKRQGQYSAYLKNIKKHNRLNKQYQNQIDRVEAQKIKKQTVFVTTMIVVLILSVIALLPILY